MKFLDMFDKYLEDDARWERRSHYASDATACRRELVYKWRGTPYSDAPGPGQYLKMKFGLAAEFLVEEGLRWMQAKGQIAGYDRQVKVTIEVPGLEKPVVIKMDFVVHEPDGRKVIIEVKSGFGRGIKEVEQRGRPKDDHLFQTFLYVAYGPSKEAVIAYLGRDNGYRHEFDLWLDEEDRLLLDGRVLGTVKDGIEYLTKRLQVVEAALRDGTLPERDFIMAIKDGEYRDQFQHEKVVYKSAWQCRYCWFKSTCWGEVLAQYQKGNNAEMFPRDRPAEEEEQ